MRDFLQDASGLMAVHRYQEAIPVLEQAIRQNPEDPHPRCLLAICLLNLEKPAAAAEMARSAIALNPEAEWPQRILSQALSAMGKKSRAVKTADEAVRKDPNEAMAHFRLAQALLSKRFRRKQAAAAVQRGLALDPDSEYGQALLGEIALGRRRWQEAEGAYRKALAMHPQEWVYMNNLAIALKKQRKTKESLAMFENAARANPRARLAQRNLYLETRRYLGAGALGLFILIQAIRVLLINYHNRSPLVITFALAVVVVFVVGWFVRGYLRKRKLSQTTRTFYEVEQRRIRRETWPFMIVWLVGAMALIFLSLMMFPALQYWSLVMMCASVVGWYFAWRWLWRHRVFPWIRGY